MEQILAVKKRQAREATLRRLKGEGRLVDAVTVEDSDERPRPHVRPAPAEPVGSRYRTSPIDAGPPGRRRLSMSWRSVRDRFLLLVEVGALIGLVVVIVGIDQTRRELNRDVVSARDAQRVTPIPTPLIAALVLPSGHKPPNASGEAAPNFDEIPAHLRGLVQSVTPMPIPTTGPGQPTRIVVPALGIDKPVVQGTDWEALKQRVGHHPGTANPGERGNLVLAAHNDVYGEIFRDLDRLKPGDEILVHTIGQVFRYVVTETRFVEPTQVEVMAPTSEPTVTLISCYPYRVDTQRIVVFASLQS